jgi:hypothetical protein
MNATFHFPIREVKGQKWCSLAFMGTARVDIVAYRIEIQNKYTFAGDHRHRYAIARDDIHLLFQKEDMIVDIQNVQPSSGPPKRRHDKRK